MSLWKTNEIWVWNFFLERNLGGFCCRGRGGEGEGICCFVQCRGEEEEEEEEMTEAAVAMQQVGTAAQAVVVALDWQSSPETRRNATAYLDSVRRPFVFSLGAFVGFFLRSLFVFFLSLAIFAPVVSEFFLSLVAI